MFKETGYCHGRYRADVQKYKLRYCQLLSALQAHMPVWTHLPACDFEKRFPSIKPETWLVGEGLVKFSVDSLSEEEILQRNYRFGGDWRRRSQEGIQEVEVKMKPGEKILLFSQDECVFKTNDDMALGCRKEGLNNHRKKKV